MGPLAHRLIATCLQRQYYRPSLVVRLNRAASRNSRLLRPLQALPGQRGPSPEEKAFLEQQGLTVEDLKLLAQQAIQQQEEEVNDDVEESDDYYAGGRSGKAATIPIPAEQGAPAAPQEAEQTAGDDEEGVLTSEQDKEAAAADAEPQAEPAAVLVEEVVEVVHTPSEYIEVEVTEEYEPMSLQDTFASTIRFLHTENLGRTMCFGVAAVLGATLGLAVYRTWTKYTSSRAQRKRLVDKNKLLVEELAKYLPDNHAKLTPSFARALKGKTGFTEVEIFRKFLWFALRERKFDQALIDDLSALKIALQLTDDDVAAALKERAQRVYDKYGSLMLNTVGMTSEGIERKATCKALFQKILYITECEALLPAASPAADNVDLSEIFGATEEDLQEARIVSLYDVDLDRLDALASAATDDTVQEDEKQGESAATSTPEPPTPAPEPAAADNPSEPPKPEFVFRDVNVAPVTSSPASARERSSTEAAVAPSSEAGTDSSTPAATPDKPNSTTFSEPGKAAADTGSKPSSEAL